MRQLVVLSGKGGTGKTSVTAAFADLAQHVSPWAGIVLTDADVDAANLALVLDPMDIKQEQFWGGKVARINQEACTHCGVCLDVCRFDAIQSDSGVTSVDPLACEGCAACFFACPREAVVMERQIAGVWYRSDTPYGPLLHAALRPAQENSGKLVTVLRDLARLEAVDITGPLFLNDGPPGIGCPVIAAVTGADLALIVIEPSIAGIHDLRRIVETTRHFQVSSVVCINKADINSSCVEQIEAECVAMDIEIVGRIPFDLHVTRAMTCGQPVTTYAPNCPASMALAAIWNRLLVML
jgi:MinD superfamily P-loop ATPase